MADVVQTAPRTFISYSWSSPTHESWVLTLATRLRQDGVDAILDKWDLQPGNDAYKFMEQMVTDQTVTKVVMVCDKKYCEKADKREGGVGAECQIISPELYGRSQQNKFAALVREEDNSGRPLVPAFYKGRIYFDFSSDKNYEAQYEELLRWLLGRPSLTKPPIGTTPSHIMQDEASVPSTESRFRRAEESIRQGAPNCTGLIRDFSDAMLAGLESLRLSGAGDKNFDDAIVKSIERARPYVLQLFNIVAAIARYAGSERTMACVLSFFERLAALVLKPANVGVSTSWDGDNFKFIAHEMFLGAVAILLKEERFDLAQQTISHPYFIEGVSTSGRITQTFGFFSTEIESLRARNNRLNLRQFNPHGSMLKDRHQNGLPCFDDLMQADLLLFLRDQIDVGPSGRWTWFPTTLSFSGARYGRPFEIFARSESRAYFANIYPLLGGVSASDFVSLISRLSESEVVRYGALGRVSVSALTNAQNIGTIA